MPSLAVDYSQKIVNSLHCNVRLILLTPNHIHSRLLVVILSATMVRPSSVYPDNVNNCIKYLKNWPDMKVLEAMKLANLSVEKVADLSLHRFIQQSFIGKMLQGLKAHVMGSLPSPPPQPDCAKWRLNPVFIDECSVVKPGCHMCAIAVTPSLLLSRPPPFATPQSEESFSALLVTLAVSMEDLESCLRH